MTDAAGSSRSGELLSSVESRHGPQFERELTAAACGADQPLTLLVEGHFGEDAAIRRIACESVLMLGGPRALLMQAAHPLVAAGIVDHSRFRQDPWRRLARTMAALYRHVRLLRFAAATEFAHPTGSTRS